MTLGRSTSGAIKIKTDSPKGLRAVECACCGGCPDICWGGGEGGSIFLSGGSGCSYLYYYSSDACDDPGNVVTCYYLRITKTSSDTWEANALNFMGPSFGPFVLFNNAIGTGSDIFTATWDLNGGYSDVPIESLISQPVNGACQ